MSRKVRVSNYFGTLCKKRHKYMGADISLRDKNGACIQCKRDKNMSNPEFVKTLPTTSCTECGNIMHRLPRIIKKSMKHFCSKDCKFKNSQKNICPIKDKKYKNIPMHYLGTLCKYNHAHNDTGMSLRYTNCNRCVQCIRNTINNYGKNNPDKMQEKEQRSKKVPAICMNCGVNYKDTVVSYFKNTTHCCSRSCARTLYNKTKEYGFNRSKLELYIEECLKVDFPQINIMFNSIKIIGVELDIYFPDFKLAIELNGVLHYKPNFGQEHLEKIQNKDRVKKQLCKENNITLVIIDNTKCRYKSHYDKYYQLVKQELLKFI